MAQRHNPGAKALATARVRLECDPFAVYGGDERGRRRERKERGACSAVMDDEGASWPDGFALWEPIMPYCIPRVAYRARAPPSLRPRYPLGDIPSAASTIGPAHCTNASSFSSMPASICVMRMAAADRPAAAAEEEEVDEEVVASW